MIPFPSLRLALVSLLAALATQGCTRLLDADPLNKTESIVNGTQVTRGPSRGGLGRGGIDSGFAATVPPVGNTFEPAVGEPFAMEELGALPGNDALLPELQNIDFGAEQGYVSEIEAGLGGLGGIDANGTSGGAFAGGENSVEYFASNIGQTVYFATDSSELNERARETLRRQAAWLNVNENVRVTVEGHADERGTRDYNLALGERRASATRGYLIAVGVDENRIDKISYGKERPVALGSDEAAWAQNRRTETVIDNPGDAFASNPLSAEPLAEAVATPTLESEPFLAMPVATDPFPVGPVVTGTTETALVEPLFETPVANDILTTPGLAPGTITYGTTTVGTASPVFDGGTIAPTVFDTGTIAPSPIGTVGTTTLPSVAPVTTAGAGGMRIEDISVDDLLRDPSLIDRLGSSGTTPPGT